MSTDRDDILEAFADGRTAIDELGLRRTLVYLRTRRWYSGTTLPWSASALGVGFPVDEELQVLPTPRVRSVNVALVVASAGRFQVGDVKVSKITPRNDTLNVGIELWRFTKPVAAPASEERHVLLLARGGTEWHVREGSERLLTPGPYNLASAIVCVNALVGAYAAHLGDDEAHTAADDRSLPSATATDLATAIAQANALRAVWVAHRADLELHPAVDPYALAAPTAGSGDGQALLVLLHALVRAFNAHVAPGDVSECVVVEAHDDKAFEHEVVVRPTRRTP